MPIYLQHGNMIDYVPPTDMTTDDVVFIGGLVGIPQFPMKSGQAGSLSVDGIYQFDKKEGVAVNFGDVVKYCGTTKLAQDCNADLTLGVAVAEAEAEDLGVNVKINSVLPTDGGGGGGEIALCSDSGLYLVGGEVAICYCGQSAIRANDYGVYLAVCGNSGLSIQNGELVASGGGGGEVAVSCGLAFNSDGKLYVNALCGCGLAFNSDGELYVNVAPGCGLAFNVYGQLVATGGGGLENLATGQDSISILGEQTPGSDSVSIGHLADAASHESTAIGAFATASGGSTALGFASRAGSLSTALGYQAWVDEKGVTVLSAWGNNSDKTQLYLIGAGSPMSTTYCDGEAGLGFMCKDLNGNILKRGTIKLSALMTENTDTFEPCGW